MNKIATAQQVQTTDHLSHAKGQGLLQRKCACGSHTPSGGECPACAAKKKIGLKRKLKVGASNDPLEREADRVADHVMAMPLNSGSNTSPSRIQRISGQASDGLTTAPASVERVLAGSGRPLESGLRQDMESRFGYDFSQVRVHTGGDAEQSARDVNAHAYTVGSSVVLGASRYSPGTLEGQWLIAHELTHVVQQTGQGILEFCSRDNKLLQRDDGPSSSVESYESLTERQRSFLQNNGIDPAALDPEVAQRMAILLSVTQRAHNALRTGDLSAVTTDPQVFGTIDQKIDDTGAEISVMVGSGDSSMLIRRRFDLATGSLIHEFAYQDSDGNQIEVESTRSGRPQILERFSLELGPAIQPEIDMLLEGLPEPEDSDFSSSAEILDEFDDFLPSESSEVRSTEGISSFFEGAIVGDFGENESWSAIGGQTVIGFVPIAGQIADVRDLLASFRSVADGREGAWLNVGIAVVGFVPGLDFLKGGSRVGRRALREAAAESITEVSEAGLRRARRVLSRGAVETARRRLRALAAGRIELMQRLTELVDNPAIRKRTSDLVHNARNSIRDHLTPQDLSGALRDRLGIPVRRSGSGQAFDHLGEVQTALDSMADARRALLGELQRLDRNSEAFRIVSRELEAMTEIRRRTLEFLETR